MRKHIVTGIIICIGLLIANSCIDPYNPSTTSANPGYLVIDGFLNSSKNSCTIKLTHTVPLNKDSTFNPVAESSATVQIEDDGGIVFPLSEGSKGEYSIAGMALDLTRKYRLKIITKSKKQYLSDFVPVVQTPPIDSITYGNERVGVHINVNTHDINNNTRYYIWSYTETWNYEAAYDSEYILLKGDSAVIRPVSFFNCYKTNNSSDLLLSSSAKLDADVISQFPLIVISWQSPKLRKKYSIIVQQRSLTKGGYEYYEQLKKNTENLGTLFGPLPSTLTGNIQCITDTQEPVIGYFTAGSVDEKRIFIARNQIKRPSDAPGIITGYESCALDSTFLKNGPIVNKELVIPLYEGLTIIGWLTSSLTCVDCRFQGGTIVKPDFWE